MDGGAGNLFALRVPAHIERDVGRLGLRTRRDSSGFSGLRDRLDLFFWAVREMARTIVVVALSAHTTVALVAGHATLPESVLRSI
jgi:hypothetical protein